MKHLREAVKRKRPNSRKEKKWMLHHNNAPTHFFPTNHSQLSCKAQHIRPTNPLLATSRTNRVLLVPEVEIHTERLTFERIDVNENSLSKLNNIP
jgi:hypothetical protein